MKNIRIIGLGIILLNLFVQAVFGQVAENLPSFDKVEIFGKLNVRLEKSGSDSILIKSDNYDVDKVKFEVEENTLKIRLLDEFPGAIKVDITVKFKQIISLIVGGGSKVYNYGTIEGPDFNVEGKSGCELDLLVKADSVKVLVNKGAFVRLTGENNYLNLKTNTGGDFRSTKMTNKETVAIMNGGTAEISCTEYLQATVRLGASLKYIEQPRKIEKKVKLKGTIGKLEDF